MSAEAIRRGDWPAALAAGCERLVHPSASGEERSRQRRLIGVLLAGPFVAAAAVAHAFTSASGVAGALAALCIVFGASWLAALHVVTRGRTREAEFAALAGASVLAGAVIALSGGLGTPVAMLLAALPLEAWWIRRSRKAALVAGVAGTAGALLTALAVGGGAAAAEPALLWASPLLYGASLALRGAMAGENTARRDGDAARHLNEDCFDAAVVRLNRAGEVDSASPRSADLLGVERELLYGTGLFDRIHVADRVAFLCAAAQARDEGTPSRCAVRIRMPVAAQDEGSVYRPFEAEFVVAHRDAETVTALIRDGRETAALREELARALEQARAVEVTKGRFLAAVSHELRTPLNAIIGFSDLLLHRDISGDLAPKQAEHVSLIREAGNHLLSVVNAILDVSKIEAGSYHIAVEPFDLKPAAELCCAMLEPQAAAKGVALSARMPQGLGEVIGDQRAVQQILLNLLSNAIKFTPEGGTVTVGAMRRDDTVRVHVNDTGIGISPDDLASLGQPFMQVQNDYTRQYQGTGLGLSLVKGLVKLHGGSMSIESAPGLGTTVAFGLPAARPERHDERDEEAGEGHDIALRKAG